MNNSELAQIADVMRSQYEADQAKFRGLIEKESRIRQALLDLDEKQRSTTSHLTTELGGIRSFGGDVIWQGWMVRARRTHQMELAQIYVRKNQMTAKLRKQFGRYQAAVAICDAIKKESRAQRLKTKQETADALFLSLGCGLA